jgi:beta-lactamase superfamily II metal-dependent hydrolase
MPRRYVIAIVLLLLGGVVRADDPPAAAPVQASARDVATVDAILSALYDVISGPAGTDRDWNRFRSLFAPGARLIPVGPKQPQGAAARVLDVEAYIERSGPFVKKQGFYEREIARRSESFGNIVHVFSTYEGRHAADDANPFVRGINSIQLLRDGERYWIVTVYWDAERPDNPLPPRYRGGAPALDTASRGLDIYFIDVDGGAATLIVTPDRESMLIDSGWPGLGDRDPKRIEHVLKDIADVDRIDHLVTTHWHTDHFGGVAGLAQRTRIEHFWDRGLPDLTKADADIGAFPDGPPADDPLGIAYRTASAGKRHALKAGDHIPLRGVEALVLASGGETIEVEGSTPNPLCASAPADLPPDATDNARSLALRFRLGKFEFLDCGDLTWNIEKKLVCPVDRIGQIDLFQVTHHGMDISNHPTLVQTIAPTVAIMDNGPRKGGAPATVKLLRSIPSIQAAYQLHKNAATGPEDNTDPALIANATPEGGQFIHVRVQPDGSAFDVQIGPDGPKRSFVSR